MPEKRPSILFVEDDNAYRYALAKRLAEKGIAVTEASDFSKALQVLESNAQIDLLLCDIQMPKDTPHGFSIARMGLMRRPKLHVLFLTGFEIPSEHELPGTKTLHKSIGEDVIVLEVETILGIAA